MSSTARDYVQRARVHLVRELKSHSEILEKLLLHGVLSDDEVREVQAQRSDSDKARDIVDSVLKKGEAACYEFLRIIDTMRKRSLESPPALPKTTESSDTFDLNHWISCFSFKEDTDVKYFQGPKPSHNYQAQLKSKAQQISDSSWSQSQAVLFNEDIPLSYTSLVLDTQGEISPSKRRFSKFKKGRTIALKNPKTCIPVDQQELSPSDLLRTPEKKILLVGKPGIGKTAVVHQMLKVWSDKDNEELDYMFYFDMREPAHVTGILKLEDLLFGVFSEPDKGKEEVLEDIKNNSDRVTIIFDGITTRPPPLVSELIQKDLLPDAKIIITCRPEVELADFLLDWDPLRVEVKGFSEQGIREYLSKIFSEEHVQKVLGSLELFTLCHIPMYALMMAACCSFESSEYSPPCTVTAMYLNILRFCIQRTTGEEPEGDCEDTTSDRCSAVLSLAEAAFSSTQEERVNLTSPPQRDGWARWSFLKMLRLQVRPAAEKPSFAFLHYTVQEFFAALWLVKNPERIRGVVEQWATDRLNPMKHLLPFACGLLNEKNFDLLEGLVPAQQLSDTSSWFFKELVTTFVDRSDTDDCEIDLMLLCQCLYECQSPGPCLCLLDKLDYRLSLRGEIVDPQHCCAVSYVVSRSQERKTQLYLEGATVSKQGVTALLGCLSCLQRNTFLSQQLWSSSLLSEEEVDYITLLRFDENQLHLPVQGERSIFERAVKVLQMSPQKVELCLHWDKKSPLRHNLSQFLVQSLPNVQSLGVFGLCEWPLGLCPELNEFFVNLFCVAAEREQQTGEKILELLSSACRQELIRQYQPPMEGDDDEAFPCDFLFDLLSHVKDFETKRGVSILPSLQPVLQSSPAVWFIDFTVRTSSALLEVLKVQPEKKAVNLTIGSHDQSEVRRFLQCLPYISQLSFHPEWSDPDEGTKFFGGLFCAATEREQQTGEKILELLSSMCSYETFPLNERYLEHHDDIDDDDDKMYQCEFLLDLCSHVRDWETETGLSVLPSLQSVFQSAAAIWIIDLSAKKSAVLLEVLKLQPKKMPVELTGCSHEESEVRSFLQCLPYISQLSCPAGFFQNVCTSIFKRSREDTQQLVSLLQLLDFNLLLTGELRRRTCCSVGRLLKLCGSKVDLKLRPSMMSVRGAALLFKHTTQLHRLRLSCSMVLLLSRWVRRGRAAASLTVEELSLGPGRARPSERVLLKAVSSLASLLRSWTVGRLDLTESCVPAQCLFTLLLHDGPLTLKLSGETSQQLLTLLHEIQDEDLTLSFLSKVGGDLTSCCLSWELLHYLLQQPSAQIITVDLRKNQFLQQSTARLLPFQDRIVFKSSTRDDGVMVDRVQEEPVVLTAHRVFQGSADP